MPSTRKWIESNYQVRGQITHLPTRPWSVGTLHAFLSAVFAPMILWGLQLAIARYFG